LERFEAWIAALEARHLAELTFSEVSRALKALSTAYIKRRGREGSALDGAGKRAAFALFYAPIHFLLIREIVRALPGARLQARTLLDLGCGTGAAGAGWVSASERSAKESQILGVDRHPWALTEAGWTYRTLGLRARTRRGDVATLRLPKDPTAFLASYALNELPESARDTLLRRLIDRAGRGDHLLVVEPLARAAAPWWPRWAGAIAAAGGRIDEWRFRVELPPIVARLDRAAGLDHRELTGRSLFLAGSRQP
jgi:hypothetical protein